MFRRSKLGIYFDALEVVEGGAYKSTQIMYCANLSWYTLNEVLETLTESRFIRVEKKGKNKRYYITDKGSRSLTYRRKALEGLDIHMPTVKFEPIRIIVGET